jgi:hypothetical protein
VDYAPETMMAVSDIFLDNPSGACDNYHIIGIELLVHTYLLSSRAAEHVLVILSVVRLLVVNQSNFVNQSKQQHPISTTFGNPSEARDLPGGPQHALMPRTHRGRFEQLDDFVLGHMYDSLGLSLPVGRCTPQSGSLV